MKLKVVSGIKLTLLLVSMITVAFNIQLAHAEDTVYIRADGTISPVSAPINRIGDVYTLTADVYDSIVVQRSNIVIDGCGYTVRKIGGMRGFTFSSVSNITVRKAVITSFSCGIFIYHSSNITILENNIIQNIDDGILVSSSNGNSIIANNITNTNNGIRLLYSLENKIYHNNFISNTHQVISSHAENIWDDNYPSGGNYWSDYLGSDLNFDGIGDAPYVINIDNQDRYPLMSPWIPVPPPDGTPPTTALTVGDPKFIVEDKTCLTWATQMTLLSEDNAGGSGLASSAYRIHNSIYDSYWITYAIPFNLDGLADGLYIINYNSTDNEGNIETTKTANIILDNSPPLITIEVPAQYDALQDGVTFSASVSDLSAVASVAFSVRDEQGNTILPEFESMPAALSSNGKWNLLFSTTRLPDGFYLCVSDGTDVFGNAGTASVQFSIRNWACIELLPSSESNKAGRTMPVKFSLRIGEAVDPTKPFVWNQELEIIIYEKTNPQKILQTSVYGAKTTNYRINSLTELYITNFQTSRKPTTYVVEILRKGMLIGKFEFLTVK